MTKQTLLYKNVMQMSTTYPDNAIWLSRARGQTLLTTTGLTHCGPKVSSFHWRRCSFFVWVSEFRYSRLSPLTLGLYSAREYTDWSFVCNPAPNLKEKKECTVISRILCTFCGFKVVHCKRSRANWLGQILVEDSVNCAIFKSMFL